jgi:hypothetical protein
MPRYIIPQENGNYAVFSTVVDDFIIINAKPKELLRIFIKEEIKSTIKFFHRVIRQIKKHGPDISMQDALDTIKNVHGIDAYNEVIKLLK